MIQTCYTRYTMKKELKISKTTIYCGLIFILGSLLRVVQFGQIPAGVTTDEAMTGYNAWTLAHYQTDMWGNHYPWYLKAWGSGMNALHEYLILPLVKFWDLNIYTERSVALVAGLLLLPLFYYFLKQLWNQKVAVIGLTLLAFNPWAVLIARQGLESNLLPFVILIAFTLFATRHFRLAAAVFACSIYAYSSVLLTLPVILGILYLSALYQKQITWRQIFEAAFCFLIIALPMLLWFAVNLFHLPPFDLGFFSVEKFTMLRQTLGNSFGQNWLVLLTQFDGLLQNATPFSALGYTLSLIFAGLGLIQVLRERNWVILAWLSGVLVLTFTVQGNINRYNLAWLPILALTALGLVQFIQALQDCQLWQQIVFSAIVACMFILPTGAFFYQYFTTFNSLPKIQRVYNQGFEAALKKAKQQQRPINIIQPGNQRYSLTLFYDRPTPHDFLKTLQVESGQHEFIRVKHFTNYTFTKQPVHNHQSVIIAPDYAHVCLPQDQYTHQQFGIYTVFFPK